MINKCLPDEGKIMKNNSGAKSTADSNSVQPESTQKPASRSARFVRRFFNVRAWSDWDRSKFITQFFLNVIERFFVHKRIDTKKKTESFDSAAAKYNLDTKALTERAVGLKRLSYILCVATLFFIGYSIYQLLYGSWKGVVISCVETLVAGVLAFRYHYWYFQIEHRTLGCGIKEWFRATFIGDNR